MQNIYLKLLLGVVISYLDSDHKIINQLKLNVYR